MSSEDQRRGRSAALVAAPPPSGWLTPKARPGRGTGDGKHGVFAASTIQPGELIALWGGVVMDEAALYASEMEPRLALQVADRLYLVSTTEGPADWINHSCDPNAGVVGQIGLSALGRIRRGEEICFDYAMTDGSPYDEFVCGCRSARCRGTVSGNDWQRPELWERYRGYFSPYLEHRIDMLQRTRRAQGA